MQPSDKRKTLATVLTLTPPTTPVRRHLSLCGSDPSDTVSSPLCTHRTQLLSDYASTIIPQSPGGGSEPFGTCMHCSPYRQSSNHFSRCRCNFRSSVFIFHMHIIPHTRPAFFATSVRLRTDRLVDVIESCWGGGHRIRWRLGFGTSLQPSTHEP